MKDPGLVEALDALVDPDSRGDPESPLRWTSWQATGVSDGNSRASYGYLPYGQTDGSLTQGDPDQLNATTPFPHSAKRSDTGSSTVDMGVWHFGPDTSRFLTPDIFNAAGGDPELDALLGAKAAARDLECRLPETWDHLEPVLARK